MLEFIKHQDEQPKAIDKSMEIADTPDAFHNCGIVLGEDIIVVDIDDLPMEAVDAYINTFKPSTMYVKTDRGIHFYYNKPEKKLKSSSLCLMGFKVEYKQSKSITFKTNGVERECHNFGDIEDIPEHFKPAPKYCESLLGLGDGERFAMTQPYAALLSRLTEGHRMLNFINENIFAEQMSDKAFQGLIGFKASEHSMDVTSRLIKEFKPVFYLNVGYWKIDGHYTSDHRLKMKVVDQAMPDMPTAQLEEAIKKVEVRCDYVVENRIFPVKFKNGILKTISNKTMFVEMEYDEFTPYIVNNYYIPEPDIVDEVDVFLNHVTENDKEMLEELLEHFGLIFETSPGRKASCPIITFLYGDGK
jgi:putative DNA primase/helicase